MSDAFGWLAFFSGFLGTLILMAERGYRDGMRLAWFLATLAVPGWFFASFRSITVDAMTGMALATLLAMCFRPFSGTRTTWVLSDLLLVAVILAGVISDAVNRTLIPGTVLELVRPWVFPYVIGRVFLNSWEDMGRTLPTVVILGAAISIFALLESVSHTNVLAAATGKRWEILDLGEGYRWGLKRAQAICNHPIYFGLLIALTLPWLLMAARDAMAHKAPRWWIAVPILAAMAAFVTVSRSAHVAILLVFACDLFFRRPQYRVPMLAIAAVGGLLFFIFREQAVDLLGAYAGEKETPVERVKIYGEYYEYTGTKHRDLLLLAYQEAIDQAGWFGYGTSLQDMPKDPNMDPRFLSMDHHYLKHYLKYGYLGIATFILFAMAAAWNLAREALARDGPLSDLAAGLFGAFVAVALVARGVDFSPDFGATWFCVAGLAASFRARRLSGAVSAPPPS